MSLIQYKSLSQATKFTLSCIFITLRPRPHARGYFFHNTLFGLQLQKRKPCTHQRYFSNTLVHMQAAGQCQVHAKPGGGDITSKREVSLANQKSDDEWKWWHISENGST